ncbi:pectate lyase [Parahaliea aestuarii]
MLSAMQRATRFMLDEVSHRGGFVWYYLPDFSRRWGELEATSTMLWVQPPGTASVGHLLLDAYHVTDDGDYLHAAQKVGRAILAAQHSSGGWNYVHDFAGEQALRNWYGRVGRHAWRLEEFQHYLGNATFDDGGTHEATLLLMRLAQAPQQGEVFGPGLERALAFILDSQFPGGGWPQRYPPVADSPIPYADAITFNDGVADGNIRLLLMAWRLTGQQRYRDAALKGMDSYLALQLPHPQPGWALQYHRDGAPAAGRSYEAAALSPAMTAHNLRALMAFYRVTGEQRFLTPIPAALDWLDSLALPAAAVRDGRTHPRVVELGSDRPLYIYRRGSNVDNGAYYFAYQPGKTVRHYPSAGRLDVAALREEYRSILAAGAPTGTLWQRVQQAPALTLPERYINARTLEGIPGSDRELDDRPLTEAEVISLLASLNERGYWPSLQRFTTHPAGQSGMLQTGRDTTRYADTWVGDASDTSPWYLQQPREVIALDRYIANMAKLLGFLSARASVGEREKGAS